MLDKNSWTYNLPHDVYRRLCACKNIKSDIEILVNVRWAWMKGKDKYKDFIKEDALVYILDLLDSNSQWHLADLTVVEYDSLKRDEVMW